MSGLTSTEYYRAGQLRDPKGVVGDIVVPTNPVCTHARMHACTCAFFKHTQSSWAHWALYARIFNICIQVPTRGLVGLCAHTCKKMINWSPSQRDWPKVKSVGSQL